MKTTKQAIDLFEAFTKPERDGYATMRVTPTIEIDTRYVHLDCAGETSGVMVQVTPELLIIDTAEGESFRFLVPTSPCGMRIAVRALARYLLARHVADLVAYRAPVEPCRHCGSLTPRIETQGDNCCPVCEI